MTNYGTIPTSSHHAPPVIDPDSGSQRPWKMVLDYNSMGLPRSSSDAFSRIKTNLKYFRTSYGTFFMIVLYVFMVNGISKQPIWVRLFGILFLLWIFLYFLRDEPIKLFSYHISDQTFYLCLFTINLSLIILQDTPKDMAMPWIVGFVLVLIHAVVRNTENQLLDEEGATT